jgi:hypothetical protein
MYIKIHMLARLVDDGQQEMELVEVKVVGQVWLEVPHLRHTLH